MQVITFTTLLTATHYDAVLPTENRESKQHTNYVYSSTPLIVKKKVNLSLCLIN
jgi:hypothetical protein